MAQITFDVQPTAIATLAAFHGWSGTNAEVLALFKAYARDLIRDDLRSAKKAARRTNIDAGIDAELEAEVT